MNRKASGDWLVVTSWLARSTSIRISRPRCQPSAAPMAKAAAERAQPAASGGVVAKAMAAMTR